MRRETDNRQISKYILEGKKCCGKSRERGKELSGVRWRDQLNLGD